MKRSTFSEEQIAHALRRLRWDAEDMRRAIFSAVGRRD
jgi:hypothetical protein